MTRGLPSAHAGHLHRLVFLDHCRERAAALPLQLLRIRDRHPQTNGDVVGEVIATDADDAGVPEAAALEDRDIGRPASDVNQCDAQLFLIGRQDGLGDASCPMTLSTTRTPAPFTHPTTF